jgi:phosphoserine phosphatase
MATFIFDFDSTLITSESLEEVLKTKSVDPALAEKITNQGMSGDLPFRESLSLRLKLAPLFKQDFVDFGYRAVITPGFEEFIRNLQGEKWIVSGAVKEAMEPVAKKLGIPHDHVLGVELEWSEQGAFITPSSKVDKWELVKDISPERPRIGIGDGITDWMLYDKGFVDYFIAFTNNVRREALIKKGIPEARNMEELGIWISSLTPKTK